MLHALYPELTPWECEDLVEQVTEGMRGPGNGIRDDQAVTFAEECELLCVGRQAVELVRQEVPI